VIGGKRKRREQKEESGLSVDNLCIYIFFTCSHQKINSYL
jgi:hypothetical protein